MTSAPEATDRALDAWRRGLPNWYYRDDPATHPDRGAVEHGDRGTAVTRLEIGADAGELREHIGAETFERLPLVILPGRPGVHAVTVRTASGREVTLRREAADRLQRPAGRCRDRDGLPGWAGCAGVIDGVRMVEGKRISACPELRTGRAGRGKKGACPMVIGLFSTIAAVFYGGTISVLALTATFARRRTLRRDARSTLAVLVPGRVAEPQPADRPAAGRTADQ